MIFRVQAVRRNSLTGGWDVAKSMRFDCDASDTALHRAAEAIDEHNRTCRTRSRVVYERLVCEGVTP